MAGITEGAEILKAISLEPGVSDEFLRRECRLDIKYVSGAPNFKENHASIVVMSDGEFMTWHQLLMKSQKDSKIVILLGSETVNLKVIKKLMKLKSVKSIYMQYRPNYNLLSCIMIIYFFFRDWRGSLFERDFWKILQRGSRRFLKSIYFLIFARKKKIFSLPLGYTSKFSMAFVNARNFNSQQFADTSLLDLRIVESMNRRVQVSFRGQINGPFRRFIYEHKDDLSQEIQMNVNQHWGGDQNEFSNNYVDELVNSRFILALPGHVSNETFRYAEALICGSLPIMTSSSALDWSNANSPFENHDGMLRYSLKTILDFIPKISEHDRKRLVSREILKLKELTKSVQNSLQASISEIEKDKELP